MPGLVPGIRVFASQKINTWMAGTWASGSATPLFERLSGHERSVSIETHPALRQLLPIRNHQLEAHRAEAIQKPSIMNWIAALRSQ
jgi:hypothetical protein